jgi:hypothetical protein
MSTVDVEVSIERRGGPKPIREPAGPRIPRITRLMALAIKFQAMIEQGEVRDYADLARLGYVTRARVTQIMNLALLAPGLQEELLFATEHAGITERLLRQIIVFVDWGEQHGHWKGHRTSKGRAHSFLAPPRNL